MTRRALGRFVVLVVALAIIVLLEALMGTTTAKDTTASDPAEQVGNQSETTDIRGINRESKMWRNFVEELKWWFPGSAAIAAVGTTVAWFAASIYYLYYFKAFGLTQSQVGISRTDVIVDFLPYGVAIGLLVLMIRGLIVIVRTPNNPKYSIDSRDIIGVQQTEGMSVTKQLVLCFVVILGSCLAVDGIAQGSRLAGSTDAVSEQTQTENTLYFSIFQKILGTSGKVSVLTWVGPSDSNILVDKPTSTNSEHYSLIRTLAQNGESTFYFDLIDCRVYKEPTIDLSIVNRPVKYSNDTPESLQIPSCPDPSSG